jgi:hypothetical protein
MICEFQLAASDFLTTMKNKVANSGICLASAALPLPGAPVYLDHLELGTAQFLTASRAALNFTAVIVSQAVLQSIGSGPLPSALTQRITGTILIDLSIDSTTGGGPYFKTAYAGVTNVADPAAAGALNAALQAVPGLTQLIPLDTSKIAKALDMVGAVPNVDVARESTGVALGIRLDFAPGPATSGAAMNFHAGFFPVRINPTAGENFAIFLDVEIATSPITKSLLKHVFTGKKHLDSPLVPVWNPSAGGADVGYDFTLRVEDACDLGPFSNDISADVTLNISYRMPTAPTMITNGLVDWDVSDWDVIVCALKTFGIGVILGAFGADVLNPGGEAMAAVELGVVGFVIPIIAASLYTPDLSSSFSSKPQCTIADDQKSFTCTTALPVPQILGPTNLTRLTGTPDGLTFVGHMQVNLVALPIINSIEMRPFTFDIQGNCTNGFRVQEDARATVNFVPQIPGAVMGAVTVCNIGLLDDPKPGAYRITPSLTGATAQFMVEPVGEPAVGCRVLFLSNGGVRILNFGFPPDISPEEASHLGLIAGLEEVNCKKLETGWHGLVGVFDPHWLVDPGDFVFDPAGVVQIWQFVVTELEPSTAITVHTQDGTQIGEAVAESNGAVELTSATPYVARPIGTASLPGLQLRRSSQSSQPGSVFHSQTLLRKQSEIALNSAVQRVGLTVIGGRTAVVVQNVRGEQLAWDITRPAFPTFLGDEGLMRASGYAGPDQSAASGDRVFVVAPGHIEIRDSAGDYVGQIRVPHPTAVFALSCGVAVRDDQGLSVFSYEELSGECEGNAKPVYTLCLEAGVTVCRPPGASARDTLFVGMKGGGEVLSFGNLEEVAVVSRYSSMPWFVGMSRKGNTVARLAPGKGDALEIFDASLTGRFQLASGGGES